MKCNDWNKLKLVQQHRYKPKDTPTPEITGWDTETVQGKAWLITNSSGQHCFPQNPKEVLAFLHQKEFRGKINYFYNLGFDFAAITKWLGYAISNALYYRGTAIFEGFKLKYIDKKLFSISKDKNLVCFYDLLQFYHQSLDNAARKYLNKAKLDCDVEKLKHWRWREKHKQEILQYCLNDSQLCQELGLHLHTLFSKAKVQANKPLSQAFLASQHAIRQTLMPRCFFKPSDEYAFNSYHGGRFEVLQRGHFDKVWIYDINSAYPDKIAKLYDTRFGYWKQCKDVPSEAVYGFLKVNASCHESWLSPLAIMKKNLLVFPRIGLKELYVTLDEFKFMERYKLASLEIVDGWFWIPNLLARPFGFVKDLYKHKQALEKEGDSLKLVYKIMLNSLYGKFLESRPYLIKTFAGDKRAVYTTQEKDEIVHYRYGFKTGNNFLPVYASLITSQARLQLLHQALEEPEHVVAMFTDSIFSTKKLGLDSDKMGEFSLQNHGELVMVGTGIYSLKGEKGITSRMRGLNLSSKYNLFECLAKVKDSTKMKFLLKQVVSYGLIAEQSLKYQYARYNCFEDLLKQLEINFDMKRDWQERFKSCSEVLDRIIPSQTLQL